MSRHEQVHGQAHRLLLPIRDGMGMELIHPVGRVFEAHTGIG